MNKVSIITVSYNSEKTIRDTIESVLNQSVQPYEYIIIDGVSTDNTVEIAYEYNEKFLNKGICYTIISEKDYGIYDAMNKGIKMASGEIIGLINSDDWYENDAIKIVLSEYNKTKFDVFYADIRLIKKNGEYYIKHSKKDTFPSSRHWNHPSTFITKNTYNEIGLYRGKGIHDDFDLILRIRRAGKKIVIKNVILANFRVGGTSNEKYWHKCLKRIKDRYHCYRYNGYSCFYIIECVGIELIKYILG